MVVTRTPRWLASSQMTLTPAQYSKTQRRLVTALGGLGVVALAAGAFVLSYDDLRLLALRGGAARHRAFLYPWMLDGLVVVVILAILAARHSGWFPRTLRWLLLFVLIAGAGAAGVQRAVKGYTALKDTPVNVGVAVAPWAILIIAVWLWVSMIKHLLGLRARRARPDAQAEPAGALEPVPATVIEQAIIPGSAPGETRRLPPPASVRELDPMREPEPARTAPSTPPEPEEQNPWEAARIPDDPEPEAQAEASAYAEPSDPVPPSWLNDPDDPTDSADLDDTQPIRPEAARTRPEESDEPEPLLPPTASRRPEPRREEPAEDPEPAVTPATDEPGPQAEAPMNGAQPAEGEPTHRWVARTSLPTDVRLVGGPKPQSSLADTQPDGFKLPDTNPDGIPIVRKGRDVADEEEDAYADERAEDPDAGEDGTAAQRDDMEATPPSSKFRSGPTPPRD